MVPTAPYDSLPFLYLTPAFYRSHTTNTQGYGFEVVRLRHGRADVAAFRAGFSKLLKRQHISEQNFLFSDRADRNASVRRAIQPQSVALGLFALLAGLAFTLGHRPGAGPPHISLRERQLDVARAWHDPRSVVCRIDGQGGHDLGRGWRRRRRRGRPSASPLMPIGPARLAEPDSGLAVNVVILGAGFAAIVVVLPLVAALPAWRAANVRAELSGAGHGQTAGRRS